MSGNWCSQNEVVRIVDKNGNINGLFPFDCPSVKHRYSLKERPLEEEDGLKLSKCPIEKQRGKNPCVEMRQAEGGTKNKDIQWSEIEHKLKSAGQEHNNDKPAPQKTKDQCT
jgi:hypothetical protein